MAPAAVRRSRLLRVKITVALAGCTVEKLPPTTIEPSGWSARANTCGRRSPPIRTPKAASTVPSALSRATRPRSSTGPAPRGCSVVNSPPITIRPSGWITSACTGPLALGSNDSSREPSALRRATFWRGKPRTALNWPPISSLPSGWVAMTNTFPSTSGSKPSAAVGVWAARVRADTIKPAHQPDTERANNRENEARNMESENRTDVFAGRNGEKRGEVGLRAGARQAMGYSGGQ